MRKIVGIEMEQNLHDELKMRAIYEQLPMKKLVENILTKYLQLRRTANVKTNG